MTLCLSCERVTVPNLLCRLDNPPPWWEHVNTKTVPRGMLHLTNARELPASASAGCPLCGLILDAILLDTNHANPSATSNQSPSCYSKRNLHQLQSELSPQPIYLRPNYDPLKLNFPEGSPNGAWHVRGLKALVPVDQGVLTGWIRLFADKGIPIRRSTTAALWG